MGTEKTIANVSVKSNIWIDPENPAYTEEQAAQAVHRAKHHIPGDLMIDFFAAEHPGMNPRSVDLVRVMTGKQQEEYGCYRFFHFRGQKGRAFDES
jgi:hypothetical protein